MTSQENKNIEKFKYLSLERTLLCSFEQSETLQFDGLKNEDVIKVCIGSYVEALGSESFQRVFSSALVREQGRSISDFYRKAIESYLKNGSDEDQLIVLCIGICCLQIFTANNFYGPFTGPDPKSLFPELYPGETDEISFREQVIQEIVFDMEGVYDLLKYPEYLIISRLILFDLRHLLPQCASVDWWAFRYGLVHQKVADENSTSIYDSICICNGDEQSKIEVLIEGCRDLSALYYIELGYFYLLYQHVGNARKYFEKAKHVLGLEFNLTGALGKRTKWQEKELPQLILKVTYAENSLMGDELLGPLLLESDLPKDVMLDDDTRLHRIKFSEEDDDIIPNLRPIEQMSLLSHLILMRKSQCFDEQLTEQTKAYLSSLLQYPKCWPLQFSALFIRCKTESSEMRAMQRSIEQLEALSVAFKKEEPSRFQRLKLIHASLLMPSWELKKEHARLLMRLGCVKTALEIFEELNLWDEVIICYNDLQMRQRSAKIVQGLLEKKETPKLWCLLGDATDDIECYNTAWKMSNEKSSRAQRGLGNYYYVRKEFKKAIEHFEISLKINTLQFEVWQRMAYSALQIEDWQTCAKAYRRCSVLEPDGFECWNNLSQAYLKLNQPHRAWKTLQEALKFRHDSWKLWDNYMLVCTTLGYTQQALYAYNQILLYKEKHVDTDILGRAVKSIVENRTDPDGHEMKVHHKKCLELVAKLARLVPSNPELWFLYAEMVWVSPSGSAETRHSAMQHYRKSVAAETQKGNWGKNTDICLLVIMRCLRLAEVAMELFKGADSRVAISDLASIVMLFKNTITGVKMNQISIETGEIVEKVKIPFKDLQDVVSEIEQLLKCGE